MNFTEWENKKISRDIGKQVNWQLIKRKIELEKLIWEQRGVKLMIADRTINKVIQQSNRIAKKDRLT